MFFSGFAKHPNYLFQWMKPLLKVMMFLHWIDKVWHQFFGRTRQNCLTPHPSLDHWLHTLAHFVMAIFLFVCLQFLRYRQCKRRVDSVAASPREYLVRRPAKNVISPPHTPLKKKKTRNNNAKIKSVLQVKKKKLIACGKVQCKRRVDRVAASPREYLVRRPAKNVISPPQTPSPPKKTTPKEKPMQNSATCARS